MPSKAIQLVFEWLLSLPSDFSGRTRRLMLGASAGAIATIGYILRDPIVTYPVYGSPLCLPISHALPRILLRHPQYGQNLLHVAVAVAHKYASMTMVDIGANVGDTAALIRQRCDAPMLCIDGNARFFNLLARNATQWVNVFTERAFVAHERGTISAHIDSHDGTAGFVQSDTVETNVYALADILDRHPIFSNPTLLKIDTDGFDTLILSGSVSILAKSRPVIYFEYDPRLFIKHDPNGHEIFMTLHSLGYTSCVFFANTGEFHACADLVDTKHLNSICETLDRMTHSSYFDVCVFHENDADISEHILKLYIPT